MILLITKLTFSFFEQSSFQHKTKQLDLRSMPPQHDHSSDDIVRVTVSQYVKYSFLSFPTSNFVSPLSLTSQPRPCSMYAALTCDIEVRDFFAANLSTFVEKQKAFQLSGNISEYEVHDLSWSDVYRDFESLMESKLRGIANKLGFIDDQEFFDSMKAKLASSDPDSLTSTTPSKLTKDERSRCPIITISWHPYADRSLPPLLSPPLPSPPLPSPSPFPSDGAAHFELRLRKIYQLDANKS